MRIQDSNYSVQIASHAATSSITAVYVFWHCPPGQSLSSSNCPTNGIGNGRRQVETMVSQGLFLSCHPLAMTVAPFGPCTDNSLPHWG